MQSNGRQDDQACSVPLDDTEQWLPDSMQALAEQLAFDAERLAVTYPPDRSTGDTPPANASSAARRGWRWAPRWLPAAAVLAITTLAISGYRMTRTTPETVDRSVPNGSATMHTELIGGAAASQHLVRSQLEQPAKRMEIDLSPAMFISQFSGPEFEAWLDLQQNTTSQRERVSL